MCLLKAGVEYWGQFGRLFNDSVLRLRGPGKEGLNSLCETEGLVGQNCQLYFSSGNFS